MQTPMPPAAPPVPNAAPPANQPVPAVIPNPLTSRLGLGYPRWPFLAAVFLNILCIFGYLLWLLVPNALGGIINNIAAWPGIAQFVSLWILFLLGWLLCLLFGYRALEGRKRPALLVSASNFELVRVLLGIYAGFVLLGLIAMLVLNEFQAFPLGLASIALFVTLWVFLRRPRRPPLQLSAQEQQERALAASVGPLSVFRSLPGVRRAWSLRPPRNQANPGQAVPGAPPTFNAPRP